MANRGGFFIHRILDENFFDMVVNNSLSVPMESDAGTTRLNDRYSVIHLPGSEFSMCGLGTYPYHTFPGIYTLNSNISLEQSGINAVSYTHLDVYNRQCLENRVVFYCLETINTI